MHHIPIRISHQGAKKNLQLINGISIFLKSTFDYQIVFCKPDKCSTPSPKYSDSANAVSSLAAANVARKAGPSATAPSSFPAAPDARQLAKIGSHDTPVYYPVESTMHKPDLCDPRTPPKNSTLSLYPVGLFSAKALHLANLIVHFADLKLNASELHRPDKREKILMNGHRTKLKN